MPLTNTMEEDQLKSSSFTKQWPKIFPPRKLWPVYLCWLLMMVATAIASYLFEFSRSGLVQCAVTGLFLGEFALAAIIGIKKAQQIGRILIDHNQFPAEELAKLRNTNVVIDGEKTDRGW